MKLRNNYFYTLRENVKDEDSVSGNLLVRSGMIKKNSAGVYMFLPLGYKVLKNIEKIIREEMNNTGALELSMPTLIPKEIYEKSGRTKAFGNSVFSLKDRFDRDYILGPTHEELFTIASMQYIKSYKDMPYTLYQFQTKFRDEARPRYGLIRVREFVMKDAYSFDKDLEGLNKSYMKMYDAYKNSFDKMNLKYRIVTADTGVMGGLLSEEFQAEAEIGEDILVLCDKCDYSSNIEVSMHKIEACNNENKNLELVATPNSKTIEEVCKYLNTDIKRSVKALLMNVNNELVIFFIRGDRTLNETKVLKLMNATEISFANDELISKSNAVPGYTGPINLSGAKVIIDEEIKYMTNFIVGANKEGYHYINANIADFKYDISSDIVNVIEGDICPKCGGKIYFKKGIEIGNTFKLGTKYSEALGLNYMDEENKLKPVIMGCYGIGIARCMAAIVEQNNDEKGIIWPSSIAPFKCAIVIANTKDDIQVNLANQIYDNLLSKEIETIMDDRDERLGVKLNDMDLIGIPYRILVGKKAIDSVVEFKKRNSDEIIEINVNNIIEYLK